MKRLLPPSDLFLACKRWSYRRRDGVLECRPDASGPQSKTWQTYWRYLESIAKLCRTCDKVWHSRMGRFMCRYLILILMLYACMWFGLAQAAQPPNIVIILADDLGYGDLGCYGHPSIRTPNLDRMAAEGMRFTDFYSAAEVCTPSRAALLTGRYPIRSGMCHDRFRVLRRDSAGGLPAEEDHARPGAQGARLRHGVHRQMASGQLREQSGASSAPARLRFLLRPAALQRHESHPAAPKGATRPAGPAGRVVGRAALSQRGADRAPGRPDHAHPPLHRGGGEVHPRTQGRAVLPLLRAHLSRTCRCSPRTHSAARAGAGSTATWWRRSTGASARCSTRCAAKAWTKNTLVFFTSDNGPWLTQGEAGGSAGLLRDGKGSTWEGGMREPGIAWWPGRIPAGVVTRELACTMDLFTTSLKLAGAECPNGSRDRRRGHAPDALRHGAEPARGVLLLPRHAALCRAQRAVQGALSSPNRPTARRSPRSTIRRCCSTWPTILPSGSTWPPIIPQYWLISPKKSSCTAPNWFPQSPNWWKSFRRRKRHEPFPNSVRPPAAVGSCHGASSICRAS